MRDHYGNAPGFLERLINSGRRVLAAMLKQRGPSDPPGDPYAAVREPHRRNPGGRSSAVALAEPEPRNDVLAVGTVRTQRNRADSDDC